MEPELRIRRADKFGFEFAKIRYPLADILTRILLGQGQIVLIMARLGAQQGDIEAAQLLVQMGRQLGKTLAGARLR